MKHFIPGAMIAMMASAILFSCEEKPEPEPQDPTVLATPSLTVAEQTETSFTVTWSAVENAVSYGYTFNDGAEQNTTETTVSFTELNAGTYTVKVKAIAPEGDEFEDSQWASISVTIEEAEDPGDDDPDDLDITGVYNIGGSDLNYEITYDEATGDYLVWTPYITGEGAYITATREGNTLVIGLEGIPEVNVGDPHGSVTVIMCAYHTDPEDPSSSTVYLWPDESCVWEFTKDDVTLTNGMFLGFQSPDDQKWYNWQGSVQPEGTVGEKIEGGTSSLTGSVVAELSSSVEAR